MVYLWKLESRNNSSDNFIIYCGNSKGTIILKKGGAFKNKEDSIVHPEECTQNISPIKITKPAILSAIFKKVVGHYNVTLSSIQRKFSFNKATGKGKMMLSSKAIYAQYVKAVINNWGTIPAGNPGAGNKPWLFVDEIEVDGPSDAG
jgi:hypothetical protein